MKKTWWVLAGGALVAGSFVAVAHSPRPGAVGASPAPSVARSPFVAAAGRVEPQSEEIKIGSQLDGKLAEVPVEEGQSVRCGQVVAVLINDDYRARVALAEATVGEKEAALDRLNNGSRREERSESAAEVREAEAVLENARAERERRARLFEAKVIARAEFETADRELKVAEARLSEARERNALVDNQTRVEDRNRAVAELAEARAQVAEARALLDKTVIRSPIDGTVLRKKLHAGESVSGKGDTPIVTLGDCSRLRVRADIDETDVSRIRTGQSAWVTAQAFGERRFTGHVIRVGQILGRKNVRTDEPTERVDTKILETLIELDPGQQLPSGLRVDTFIDTRAQ
jgi:ABC exporter DevB family membrane fusion protein